MKKVVISALVAGMAVAVSCSSSAPQGLISAGDKSKMDTLSYALGTNVGYSIAYQMTDIPFDYKAVANGIEEAAFEKSSVNGVEAVESLRTYFMEVRPARAQLVAEKRAEADSIAIAGGADPAEVAAANKELPADADMFESEAQRNEISYAFGVDLGTNMRSADIPVQVYWVTTGMQDVANGSPKLGETESSNFLRHYFTEVRPEELGQISVEKLAEIEKKSGVKKSETGLLYRIEKEGDADVKAIYDTDVVKVNYTGRLVRNDKVFDTSRYADRTDEQKEALKAQKPEGYDQDSPIEFALNRVIPGWTEGMKLVGKGGRISLWIPSPLAYGSNGAGNDIGPNEALYFDVEILDVISTPDDAE